MFQGAHLHDLAKMQEDGVDLAEEADAGEVDKLVQAQSHAVAHENHQVVQHDALGNPLS